MSTYARAVGIPKLSARSYWLNKQEYEKAKDYATIEGENHILTPPEEVLNEKEKCEVVYHTQAASTGKVENVTIDEIEECLKNILNKTVMIERGCGFGTVVVTFKSEEDASLHATTEKIIMAPSYKGKRLTKIRIGRVPVKISVEWVLACLFKNEDIEIEEVGTTSALNWWGFGIECWVNVTPEQIVNLPYEIIIKNGKRLNVIVYGRKPTCYFCKQVGHLKKYCPEKKEEERKNVELVTEVETGGLETETITRQIYEKISSEEEKTTGSEEFMMVKRRKITKKKNKTSEQTKKKEETKGMNTEERKIEEKKQAPTKDKVETRKKESETTGGKKEKDPNEWLVMGSRYEREDVGITKKMIKSGEVVVTPVDNDTYMEVLSMTRKVYKENDFWRYYMNDIIGVLEVGQVVKVGMSLEDILEMNGDFKERWWDDGLLFKT